MVETYLNGILPRSDDALNAGSSWLRGRLSEEEFHAFLDKETKEFIKAQEDLEFDFIVDGQLFWQDFLRPVAAALKLHKKGSNANENAVTRQVYTNTFYRRPVIDGKNDHAPIVDLKYINGVKGRKKVILPSPFALIDLAEGAHKDDQGNIIKDVYVDFLKHYAGVLNQEAKRLEGEGIDFIQFNEPVLLYSKNSKDLFSEIVESIKVLTNGLTCVTSLHIYNGDASKFGDKIFDFAVDRIGLDAYNTNLKKFPKFPKFLELGIVNTKNSLVESPEQLKKYAEQVQERLNPEGLALVPNRPLDLVTTPLALKKLEALAEAKRLLE